MIMSILIILYIAIGMGTAAFMERHEGQWFLQRQFRMRRSSAVRLTCEIIGLWPKVWGTVIRRRLIEWRRLSGGDGL